MKRKSIILTISLISLGIFLFLIYMFLGRNNRIKLELPDNEKWYKWSISYKTEAIFNEINLPDIKNIEGSAKFIENNIWEVLWYKISIEVAKLDKSKVPSEYLKDKESTINGVKTTLLWLSEVLYEVSFNFTFFNKDGFEIYKTESKSENIESWRTNNFQNIIEESIPKEIIKNTKKIEFKISVNKCLSCEK